MAAADDGFHVALDDRPLRTPAGTALVLPTAALADLVRREWDEAPDPPDFAAMTATRLAATAHDRVAPDPGATIDDLLAHAEADALCYRAEAPEELVRRQRALWTPLLDWAATRLDAPLIAHDGVMPAPQPVAAVAALGLALRAVDPFQLVAIAEAARVTGSLVLALAMAAGRIDASQAFEAAMVEELFQAERWGADAEADARRRALADEVRAIAAFLSAHPPAIGVG